jgi:hypothetical protein
MARSAWEAFKRIWTEWQAPHELEITWPFALLGEVAMEQEDDPPGTLTYHTRGFTYPRQALDILHNFIVFRFWTKRCRKHFDDKYSLKAVLTQAWVATVEVGMASWKPIRSQRPTKDPDVQARIELDFRNEWLHLNILGTDQAIIKWHFLPPLNFLPLSNEISNVPFDVSNSKRLVTWDPFKRNDGGSSYLLIFNHSIHRSTTIELTCHSNNFNHLIH